LPRPVLLGLGLAFSAIPVLMSAWLLSGRTPRIRSRYAILDRGSYKVLRQRNQLSFINRTVLGDLYINHSADNGE